MSGIIYENYEGLLHDKAWSTFYSVDFDVEYDEILNQCKYIFVSCQKNYDELKGVKFSTFLTKCLDLQLKRWLKNSYRQQRYKWDVLDQPRYNVAYPSAIMDLMASLETDCQEIVNLIINCPELAGITGTDSKTVIKKKAMLFFQEKKGWSYHQFIKKFNTIRGKVNELSYC